MLAATRGPVALWYLTRGTGIVALILLTATTVIGIVATVGWTSQRWPRFLSQSLHRNLSLLCLSLIVVHIVTTVVDGFAPIGYLDAIVPFRSPYRPIWLGLGALAFDILIAVGITTALRHRIGRRWWRGVHWLAYLSWPVALLHTLGTGTDTRLSPVLALDVVCVVAVLVAVGWRLSVVGPTSPARRLAAGSSVAAVVLGIGVFTVVGPLKSNWARRAGTPASLLPHSHSTSASASSPARSGSSASPSTGAGSAQSFTANLSGSYATSQPNAQGIVTVDIRASLSGGSTEPLEIQLTGSAVNGGVQMQTSRVSLGQASGKVVSLAGDNINATVSTPGGATTQLTIRLQLDPSSGKAVGQVTASPAGSG